MLSLEVKVMMGLKRTANMVGEKVRNFFTDEEGDTNFISIIVILVIVLGVAVVFRENIARIVNNIWEQVFKDVNKATNTNGSAVKFN